MDYIYSRIQKHKRKGIMVGITTRCSEDNFRWLKDFLTKEFKDLIQDVEYLPITNRNRYEWEDKIKKYSSVILYHSKHQGRVNITDVEGGIYNEELNYLCHTLGRDKVLVVLDDMEDTSMEERQRVLDAQPSLTRLSSQLILIPETGKHGAASTKRGEFLTILETEQSRATPSHAEENSMHQKCSRIRVDDDNICSNGLPTSFVTRRAAKKKKHDLYVEISHCSPLKYKVGIFSRSAEENYGWLMSSLQTSKMKRSIDVRSVYISNNGKMFYSEMPQCNLAILYHTKKQGRLNITNVTDSLYDQELKELSEYLGRKHVIVVLDDLGDTSDAEKMRIKENQPSIGCLAEDLFLFSEKHKDPEKLQEILTLIEEGVAVHVKTRPLSPSYIGAQGEDEQHEQLYKPPGVNSETTPPNVDINTSQKYSTYTLLGDHRKSPSILEVDDLSHLRGITLYKPPGANSETTPLDMDINASPSHSISSVCSDDHGSYSVWDDMYNLETAALHKATGSKYKTTSSSLDNYTSRKRHNYSLHGPDNESSASKKNGFDCPPTEGWMESQLTELNDSYSVFSAMFSKFNNAWQLFQQEKRNPQTANQKLLSKIQTQEAELKEKDIIISNLRKNLEEKEEVCSFKSEIQDKQRTIEKDNIISSLGKNLEEKEEEVCSLKSEIQDKQRTIEEKDIIISSLGKNLEEKEEEVCSLKSEIQDKQRTIEEKDKQGTIEEKDIIISSLGKNLEEKEEEVHSLKSEIQDKQRTIEKDNIISSLGKNLEEKEEEVCSLKSEIQDKQRTIEEKDKFILEMEECRDRPAEKMQERDRDNLQHSAGKLEEIIKEKDMMIMQLCDEIQKILEKFQDKEKSGGLQEVFRKRRGEKKWSSINMEEEQDGDLDAPRSSEPETMENHSNLEDVEPLDDKTCNYRHKVTELWRRIAELGSRVKQLEYTRDYQKHELDTYRQTVKEQSSQINEYAEVLDTLNIKIKEFRKM